MNTEISKLLLIIILCTVASCKEESNFFDNNKCPTGKRRDGPVCISDSSANLEVSNMNNPEFCIDPELSGVKEGVNFTLCDGTIGRGTLKLTNNFQSCINDGEQGCIVTSGFKAADTLNISPSDIKYGKTIAGIKGERRDVKQCRNASNTSYFDTSPAAATVRLPGYISSFPGGNAVGMAWTHGLSLNDPIQLSCIGGTGTGLPGGQVNTGTTYYAIAATASNIQFQAAPSSGALSVTGITGCTGTWIVAPAGNITANNEDTIDDQNGSATTPPSQSPWGSDYICDQSSFTNVTGSAPLAPSNTTPTNGNKTWTDIWRNDQSGMLFTNILYDGVPNNRDWYQLNDMCKSLDSLNGNSGGSGWRLPSQKELMQLYINGISKLTLAGGTNGNYFWSSSSLSWNAYQVWVVQLSAGYSGYYSRNSSFVSAICVR